MLKSLTVSLVALGALAVSGLPALAGGGCGGAVTAQGHGSQEVAQIDQSGQQPAQTPRPAQTTTN